MPEPTRAVSARAAPSSWGSALEALMGIPHQSEVLCGSVALPEGLAQVVGRCSQAKIRGRPRHSAIHCWGCGRRVAIALGGEGTQRGRTPALSRSTSEILGQSHRSKGRDRETRHYLEIRMQSPIFEARGRDPMLRLTSEVRARNLRAEVGAQDPISEA